MSGQILLCSSLLRTCTWKIVFKIENNELNELSECILYKIFFFFGKHLKTVKLSFTIIFQKPCLLTLKFPKLYVLACFCTCLLLKVYKTFNIWLLALLCFSLKAYKTFLNSFACLLYLACFKVYKNFYKPLSLKMYKTFLKSLALKSFQNFL